MTVLARRANVILVYEGADISADIAPFLLEFNYEDNTNKADDCQVTLQDRDGLWRGDWYPAKGSKIKAAIVTEHWDAQGKIESLPCGSFTIDSINYNGFPDVITFKGASVPTDKNIRREKKTRAWENVFLSRIAQDIIISAGLKLVFEVDEDILYKRVDQRNESDLALLKRLCEDEGISMKVSDAQIVLYDEAKYESKDGIRTIVRGSSDILGYEFSDDSDDIYSSAEVKYQDTKAKKTVSEKFTPDNGPNVGRSLKINERADSRAHAQRKAKKQLRQKNKNEIKAKLSLTGDVRLVCGVCMVLSGWGHFDGRYIIEKASHRISGSGYTVGLELRKVLEGY